MTDQELRTLVREAIARQTGRGPGARPAMVPATFLRSHASHGQFDLPPIGSECLIEPSVPCEHCGYCRSYGH